MKFKHSDYERHYRKGILRKVFIILFVVTVIPLLIMMSINRLNMSEQSVQHSISSYGKICGQTSNYLSDKASTVKSIMDMLSSDSSIQDLSILHDVSLGVTSGNWVYYDNYTSEIIFKSYLNQNITHIFLYLNHSVIEKHNSEINVMLNDDSKLKYSNWLEGNKNYIWLTSANFSNETYAEKYVFYASKIPSGKALNSTLGYMQADVPISILESILSSAMVTENTNLMLLNENDDVFVSSGFEVMDKKTVSEAIAEIDVVESSNTLSQIKIGGESYLAGLQFVENTDWKLLFLVPYSDILEITRSTNQLILLTILLIIAIIIPVFFVIARSMTQRLRNLNNSVIAAMDGDYGVYADPGSEDEIGQISENFNLMLKQTVGLMDEKYKMGQSLKNAEMQILQEQINPHFLYNTLDMLHWMAIRSDAEDIDKVVRRLSQFYKLSLSSGDEMISISHELMQVEAYADIQNIRFNNRIKLSIDVPQGIRECSIVKIVFQPLVENSIQHGLREQGNGKGNIIIKGTQEGDEIVFTITDDGIGMEEHEVASIISEKRSRGYGIHNINERLVLHYGESARLSYKSKIGKGTQVTFRIPKTIYKNINQNLRDLSGQSGGNNEQKT